MVNKSSLKWNADDPDNEPKHEVISSRGSLSLRDGEQEFVEVEC